MLELVLVRHGQTDGNKEGTYYGWLDFSLNEIGKAQALKIREKIKDMTFEAIYTSPLRRALETTRRIKPDQDTPILLNEALKELHFGEWEGMTCSEIQEKFPQLWDEWCKNWVDFCFPRGESFRQLYQRVTCEIDHILQTHRHGKVLIVSHHGCIRGIISYLLGTGIEGYWRYKIKPGTISRIEIVDGYCVLTGLNQ